MEKKLGVNIDHVATVREARRIREPDPVLAAGLAELAGADQITVHLREDRRHIQERDVRLLRSTVRTRLNFEMAPSEEMIQIALSVQPDMVTLVPENRHEVTTEGGLDVAGHAESLEKVVATLRKHDIEVALFIDPDTRQTKASKKIGADAVEYHTGAFANAFETGDSKLWQTEADLVREQVNLALKLGLKPNAGHGLNYQNVGYIACIPGIIELNIGHSIVSRAIFEGFPSAVREMKRLIREAELFQQLKNR